MRRMEAGFGTSLNHVRIHTDEAASRHNEHVSASAFTLGNDIFFGAGQYQPDDPVGEHMLAHEIAHVLSEGQPTIRRVRVGLSNFASKHQEQNQDHLRGKGVPISADAAAAAIWLDHNHDEDTARLLSTDDFEAVRLQAASFPTVPVQDLVIAVQRLISSPPSLLTDPSKDPTQDNDITWSPVNDNGDGTGVLAHYLPGRKHADGSDAGGWQQSAIVLARRSDSTGTFYVRGHLLNRHLGGPGLNYNLVPLTGRAGHGGNNANKAHSAMFEEVIKEKYEKLGATQEDRVTQLSYQVNAHWSQSQRPATPTLTNITEQLTEGLRQWRDWATKPKTGPGGAPLDTFLSDDMQVTKALLEQGHPQAVVNNYMDAAQRRETWAASESVEHLTLLSKRLDSFPDGQELLAAIAAEPLLEKLASTVTADLGSVSAASWYDLKDRVEGNLNLWLTEEEVVPSALEVLAKFVQYGQVQTLGPERVAVIKPDELFSPYWHVRASSF